MSNTLTFTATHRTGNFVRIFAALRRLGIKPLGGTINNSTDPQVDTIQINLKSGKPIEPSTIKKLKEMIPTIVDIQVEAPSVARTSAAPPKVASTAQLNTSTQADPVVNQPSRANVLPKFDDERLDFETKRLAGVYPDDIHSALKYMEAAINPAQRQFVLTQLGIRIGMYAARKRKAAEKDSGINKTVRGSLAMQKAQFGRVSPVIAAMMNKKVARQTTSKQSKSKILVSELENFLAVSLIGNEIYITDCPHCESTHSPQSPDCYFIAAFIDSFIKDMWGKSKHSITQKTSRAMGAPDCVFVVSGIRL